MSHTELHRFQSVVDYLFSLNRGRKKPTLNHLFTNMSISEELYLRAGISMRTKQAKQIAGETLLTY